MLNLSSLDLLLDEYFEKNMSEFLSEDSINLLKKNGSFSGIGNFVDNQATRDELSYEQIRSLEKRFPDRFLVEPSGKGFKDVAIYRRSFLEKQTLIKGSDDAYLECDIDSGEVDFLIILVFRADGEKVVNWCEIT